eukprot:scaffold108347_cov53-Phaeocystis_antarctica.AAC.4
MYVSPGGGSERGARARRLPAVAASRRARTRATRASPAFGARCPRAHVGGPSRPWRDLEGPEGPGLLEGTWRDPE